MRTNILKEIPLNELRVGKYLCLPVVGLQEQPIWLVEVYEAHGFLCYQNIDGQEYVGTTCGHRFFDVP